MSILDAEVASLDGIDKNYHALYTQKDGKWLLTGVKGYTPEERETVTKTLKKERDAASAAVNALKPYKTLFGDKKPEEIQAQLDRIEELEASNGKVDEAEIEKRAQIRAQTLTKPIERKLTEATEKLTKSEATIKSYQSAEEKAAISAEIQKHALASSALPESYAAGGGLLAVLQGQLTVEVEVDAEGNRKLGKVVTADGKDVPALLKQIQTTQGYFWAPSKGGGANAGGPGGPAPGVNPFKAGPTFNRTHQMALLKDNPTLAKQYQESAKSA